MPSAYHRIRYVSSFEELIATPFENGINALCWPRTLKGDFAEIADLIGPFHDVATQNEEDLNALTLSPGGRLARQALLADQALLQEAGLDPILDYIPYYPRDENPGPVPLDVYDFHADSADIDVDTYLCTYHGASSLGIANEDAIRYLDIPEIRQELLALHGGSDDQHFQHHLTENFYDLHYTHNPKPITYSFGLHNLWRIATQNPFSKVPPCIHRAPTTDRSSPPRLLLIS
ncbi:MAG: hypothetical protein AAGB46_18915 [Verrucomicrobiota bacterium]